MKKAINILKYIKPDLNKQKSDTFLDEKTLNKINFLPD